MHQFDVNFDAQDDNSVPKTGPEARKDSDESRRIEWIDKVVAPIELPSDVVDVITCSGDPFEHITLKPREQQQLEHRSYLLAGLTTLLSFTLLGPPLVIPALPNGMALLDKPAYMEMVSKTQYLVTTMYCLFILLYYFPNAGLLTALESVTKKFLDSFKK
jgi:hypothetical protein